MTCGSMMGRHGSLTALYDWFQYPYGIYSTLLPCHPQQKGVSTFASILPAREMTMVSLRVHRVARLLARKKLRRQMNAPRVAPMSPKPIISPKKKKHVGMKTAVVATAEPPTRKQLRAHFIKTAVPMIGFGFVSVEGLCVIFIALVRISCLTQ